jgi:hypothetical protein
MEIVNALPAEVQLHPKNFTHVLTIVREHGRYFYSLSPQELFWYALDGLTQRVRELVEHLTAVTR